MKFSDDKYKTSKVYLLIQDDKMNDNVFHGDMTELLRPSIRIRNIELIDKI